MSKKMNERICDNCKQPFGDHFWPSLGGRCTQNPAGPKFAPIAEPSPEPEAAPASETQAPEVAENGLAGTLPPADYRRLSDYWMERTRLAEAEVYALRDELAQLRARVAIFDAQKVELPATLEEFLNLPYEQLEEVKHSLLWWRMVGLYPQLLDALMAVQAWREVAQSYRADHRRRAEDKFRHGCGCRRCLAYGALDGKGE